MRPLCSRAQNSFARLKDLSAAHKGLLFERFYDNGSENNSSENASDSGARYRYLDQLVGKAGDKDLIDQTVARRIRLVTDLGGEFGVFRTDGYFVTGMGNDHPAENGFTWHPVLGTPCLPGSGVKGLLRAWMETCVLADAGPEDRRQRLHEWFGCDAGAQTGEGGGKAGDLIFFDALPLEPPVISVDIMTPHMGKWYEQGGETATPESMPGDWHNPVPVPFLVATESRFLFAIAPRSPQVPEALVREAMEHLIQALAWLGAGAKTAAGYGHMSFEKEETLRYRRKAQADAEEARTQSLLASMTPGQRVLHDIEQCLQEDISVGRREPGGVCKQLLHQASEQAQEWPPEERQALLELARRVLAHHDGEKWKKKNKPKQLYGKIRQLVE